MSPSENFVSNGGETRTRGKKSWKKNRYLGIRDSVSARGKEFEKGSLFKSVLLSLSLSCAFSCASAKGKVRRISRIRIQVVTLLVPEPAFVYVTVKPMQIAFPNLALTDLKAI